MASQIITKSVRGPDRGRPSRWPFREMDVGDLLPVPGDDWKKARAAAYKFGQRNKREFVGWKTPTGGMIRRIG